MKRRRGRRSYRPNSNPSERINSHSLFKKDLQYKETFRSMPQEILSNFLLLFYEFLSLYLYNTNTVKKETPHKETQKHKEEIR